MSPIEHYFENLLTMGSDIKGEPNKNALSKEVQDAVEICAYYIKHNQLLDGEIEIIHKYQKITEIVKSKTTRLSYDFGFEQIKKVVEDGSN